MRTIEPCQECKHRLLFGCKAFPNGIPDEIAQGIKLHDTVLPEQVGSYVFEKGESELDKPVE